MGFMVDWTLVLPHFMELWLWKLTTVCSRLGGLLAILLQVMEEGSSAGG